MIQGRCTCHPTMGRDSECILHGRSTPPRFELTPEQDGYEFRVKDMVFHLTEEEAVGLMEHLEEVLA